MGFKSALGEIGPAIQQAAGAFANMFANRAERNYQEGVSLIADAKEKRTKLLDAASQPDVKLSPDEEIVKDSLLSYYDQLVTMGPNQALAFAKNNPEPTSFRITKTPVPGTPGTAPEGSEKRGRAFAESSGEQVRGTPGGVSTTTAVEPASSFLARLQQRGAQGVRQYEMFVTKQGQEAILLRDRQGFDFQFSLADMQMLHDLKMQGNEQEYQRVRDQLAREHNLDIAEVEHGYRMTEANNAFENQMTFAQVSDARKTLEGLRADLSDPGKDPKLTLAVLRGMADSTEYPSEIRDAAQRAIDGAPVRAAELYQASADAFLEDAKAKVEEAKARGGTALEMAEAGLRTAQANADTARINVGIASTMLTINGQQIALNDLAIDGETFNQTRSEWEFNREKVLANTSDAGAASAYVQGAIAAGDVGSLEALLLAVEKDPNADPALMGLTVGMNAKTVRDAIELAREVYNNTGLQLDSVKQSILHDIENGRFNSLRVRADVIDILGRTYTAEQLDNLRDLDPEIAQMIDSGKLPMGVVKAAQAKATFRTAVEKNTANKEPILAANANLDRMAQAPADGNFDAAELAVRRELERLVDLGAMSPDAVDGLVDQYRNAWAEQNETTDLAQDQTAADTASRRAQREQMLYEIESGRASAATAGQTAAPKANMEALEGVVDTIVAAREGIEAEAKVAGCIVASGDVAGAVMVSEDPKCAVYSERMLTNAGEMQRVLNIQMQSAMGGPPMVVDPATGESNPYVLGSADEAQHMVQFVMESAKAGAAIPPQVAEAVQLAYNTYGPAWFKAAFHMSDAQAIEFINAIEGGTPAAIPTAAPAEGAAEGGGEGGASGSAFLAPWDEPWAGEPVWENNLPNQYAKFMWRLQHSFHGDEALEDLGAISNFVLGGAPQDIAAGAAETVSTAFGGIAGPRQAANEAVTSTARNVASGAANIAGGVASGAVNIAQGVQSGAANIAGGISSALGGNRPAPIQTVAPRVPLPSGISAQTFRDNLQEIGKVTNYSSGPGQQRLRDLATAYDIFVPENMAVLTPAYLGNAMTAKYGNQPIR